MPVAIKGSGGGSVTLDASTAASDTTLTLPNTTGTVALTASQTFSSPTFTGNVTFPGTGIWNSSGVGIGTSSPQAPLDVAGSLGIRINEDGAGTKVVSYRSNYAGLGPAVVVSTADPYLFYINGAERARIDSSGNFLFNTTSSWTPPGGTTAKTFNNNGYAVGNSTTSANFANDRLVFNGGQYYVLNGSSTGVVLTSGNTSWSAQSDERLKDIIEPISNAVEKVSTLRSVIGKYKTDEDDKRRAFLLAQDVQAVLPEAVTTGEDGYLLLGYTETIPLLVAAIQELKADLDAAKAEIASLKGTA